MRSAALSVALACVGTHHVAATVGPRGASRYVAMGDSYSAGEGAPPFDDDCRRGPRAWPRLLDPDVVHVACTGARVDDLAAQAVGLDAGTRLVTVTIGGNDAGFSRVLSYCVAAARSCVRFDRRVRDALAALEPQLTAALADIDRRAPNARVVVVAYPQITRAGPPCRAVAAGRRGIDASELAWLARAGRMVNQTLAGAAAAAGVEYLPASEAALRGHELCTTLPWVHGIRALDPTLTFHPNVHGHAALCRAVAATLRPQPRRGSCQ